MRCIQSTLTIFTFTGVDQLVELYISRHDPHEDNVAPAESLWSQSHCTLPATYLPALLKAALPPAGHLLLH